MKKKMTIAIVFTLLFCIICGCGSSSVDSGKNASQVTVTETSSEKVAGDAVDIDLVNTRWKDDQHDIYFHFEADGKLTSESVMSTTTTSTSNGSTSTHTSKSLTTQSFTWSREGDVVTVNNSIQLTISLEDGVYKLIGANSTYTYTDKDPLADEDTETKATVDMDAEQYAVNSTISTDTIEMTFTEKGVAEDIRTTSKESGIKVTSGPSPQSGKKFIYLKGKVKNLNTSTVNINMSGVFTIDGYTFDMKVHAVDSAGSPLMSIDPLDEYTIILYAPVSNELIDNYNEANLTFGFNDYFDIVMSLEDAGHLYIVNY